MINNKYSNRYVKIIEWIFLYLSITDSLSFLMGDSTLSLKFLSPFVLVTKVLLIVYFFVLALKLDIPFNYNMLWLPLVIWLVYFFSSINGELYFGLLGLMILCGFCVLPNIVKANIYRKYRLWIIVMSILGIIAYLSYSLNLGLPYKIVDFYSVGVEGLYIDYFFSVLLKGVFDLRLCGLFNEPGFLGTIIALILIIEKCNLKKVGNVIMLIAGVLTFSFAFYVILIIYFLMRMLKRPLTVIAIFSIFAVFMNYIQNIRFENSQVQYIVNRFVFDKSTGRFAGDNRTSEDFDIAYQRMIYDGDLLLGKGLNSMVKKDYTSSSYKSLIYKHGLLGFVIIVGSLFVASFPIAKRNKKALLFLICFFISIYQRPNVYTLTYFCLLFGGLSYIKERDE